MYLNPIQIIVMYATYSHWLSLTEELVNAPRGREIEIIYLCL